MDRPPHHGGQGQRPPNQPGGGQRPNLPPMSGSIPRRTLPPPARHPPMPHSLGPGYAAARPPPQMGPPPGYRPHPGPPPPHQYPPPPHHHQPYAPPYQRHPPPPARAPPPSQPTNPLANVHIPRKKPPASAPRPHRLPTSPIAVKSEKPFIIRIKRAREIPMRNGGIPRMRSSSRTPKRKRPTYEELRDTDSDDFFTDSDDDEDFSSSKKGRLQKARKQRASPTNSQDVIPAADDVIMTEAVVGIDGADAPPPGTLSTLWYSREIFLNIFVLEKIIGWKTRPVTTLQWHNENDIKMLDPQEASSISNKLLLNEDFWNNRMKRMEVSRIHASQCPVVLAAAAAKEGKKETPRYSLAPRKEDEREEVLLVKWRGRSHVHCSWERRKDLEKFDPSNNTARNKIRRYFQGQEIALGKDWKKLIESERAANADPVENGAQDDIAEEEEFFPPQNLEVERILACDENEMDLKVLAKQRALNVRTEQEARRRREEEEEKLKASEQAGETIHHAHRAHRLLDNLPQITDGDPPWDPEDNVRYVVKWKGLQYAEMTWEYWRDIKRDAVDECEDFWYRQKAPSMDEINKITSRPHPHVRDFRKLPESPEFAISRVPRPVADLGDGFKPDTMEEEEDKESSDGFKLRSYQLEGVNWLLFNWFNKRSCILADEMGLGKTIQSVGFLHQLNELPTTQVRGPFLIVAPLSLIVQWQSESHTWAPDLNVIFYHGSAEARDFLAKQEFYYTEQFVPKGTAMKLRKKHITKFHILITTYEVVLKDIAVLSKIRWKALIVDEAHRLKNPKARLFEELATVPRDFCLLLTGTPLQNSTEELWALLNFADPVTFKSKDSFIEKFGQLTDAKQVSDLHSMLKPYLLRRVKEDVEKALPPKEETILEVSLTPTQKTYYKAIYEKNTSFLFKGAKPSNAPSLMNVMMELRKCCNHPFLVRGAEERMLNETAAGLKGKKDENGNEIPVDYLKLFGDQLVNSSGKMVLLAKLLPKLYAGGHKVLIFSQMVRCLDLLEEFLKMQKYKYERLDGSTTASARTGAVDRFHRKSCQRFVMLLSTRAGGLGLNLTAADVVIIFDSDWNPQNDLQAMARAHRIGQTRAVAVYRLLTAKTYEMHMFHAASLKLGLDRAVLAHQRQQETEEGQDVKSKTKSEREVQAKEIDELLKKGAYDVFRDEDDAEAKQFLESDIDQLLERSAKKVTYGDVNASSMSSGLGSFSKASFVADTGDGAKDVDLDDPDFWSKAVGLEVPVETPEEIAQMIDDGVKRSRKQVQQFDPYAAFAEAEQKKKDKVERKAREEKEEKERLRELKRAKKLEARERKKREKEEARGRLFGKRPEPKVEDDDVDDGVKTKDVAKTKKMKRLERRRALRRAENEDPLMERLKQAWEATQRNRATSAALRFGFGRFCKLRSESNLTSLPIQDLEVFVRSYVYQLSLQVAVTLLGVIRSQGSADVQLRDMLPKWLGGQSAGELEWICGAVYSALEMQLEVENRRRSLRMPSILAESSYLEELRQGAALRSIRRLSILSRLNAVVENALDSIITDLGQEELGKRGCLTKDLSTLDADLKARFVTTEELNLALSAKLCRGHDGRDPCTWWDRSCDVALVVGTFVHGLGNYESMGNDEELPFGARIRAHASTGNREAQTAFLEAGTAAKTVFDDALDSSKWKAQEEAHQAVAAVLAASKEEGSSGTTETARPPSITPDNWQSNEVDSDDTHLVTLTRLSNAMTAAVRSGDVKALPTTSSTGDAMQIDTDGSEKLSKKKGRSRFQMHQPLPMPDARLLDRLLLRLIDNIEGSVSPVVVNGANGSSEPIWETEPHVTVHEEARSKALTKFLGLSKRQIDEERYEFSGIGFNGTQCAATHKSLDDGSEFSVGAATSELSHVSTGPEAPRYLRSMGVPMNVTRYATTALIFSDSKTLETVLSDEQSRSSNESDEKPVDGKTAVMEKDSADKEQGSTEKEKDSVEKEKDNAEKGKSTSTGTEKGAEQVKDAEKEKPDEKLKLEKPNGEQKEGTGAPEASAEADAKPTEVPSKAPAISKEKLKPEKPNGEKKEGTDAPETPAEADAKPTEVPSKPPAISKEKLKPEKPNGEKKEGTDTPETPAEADAKPTEVTSEPTASPAIAPAFRNNASLRAGICVTALHLGYSTMTNNISVNPDIWNELRQHVSSTEAEQPDSLYSTDSFTAAAASVTKTDQADLPSTDLVSQYVETVLLPHCLRLCVNGNGPSTRNARGSKGKFETAYGISIYPEYTSKRQTPLPDPCCVLTKHSMEAVACASAILRRTRLMRAAQYIVSGGVPFAQVSQVLQSDAVRDSMDDLPLWWRPEIHDLGLLVHAATRGLLSILGDREAGLTGGVFSHEVVKQHVRNTQFFSTNQAAARQLVESEEWIEEQSRQFPSANALERRLGLLCAKATAHLGNDDARYDNLPMFDHGGWPRN